jgi:hypothetical protein
MKEVQSLMTEVQYSDDIGGDEQSVLSLGVKAIDAVFEKCSKGSTRSDC